MIRSNTILLFSFALIALVQHVQLAPVDGLTEIPRTDAVASQNEKRYVLLDNINYNHNIDLFSDEDKEEPTVQHLEARGKNNCKCKSKSKSKNCKCKSSSKSKSKPKSNAKKTKKKKKPSSGGSKGSYSGDGTYYNTGLGSCGITSNDHQMVAALNAPQMGQVPNPNNNPNCGKYAKVKGPKGTVTVKIVDTCPPCLKGSLDLSPAAFAKIADLAQGRVKISWSWA